MKPFPRTTALEEAFLLNTLKGTRQNWQYVRFVLSNALTFGAFGDDLAPARFVFLLTDVLIE